MNKLELNEEELQLLKEISNGRTEVLKDNDGKGDPGSNEFLNIHLLKNVFSCITYDKFSDEKSFGYINLELTDKGKYLLNPEQLKKDLADRLKESFNID